MEKTSKVLIKNVIMMYLISIAKIVIPLISLPYLTRVLSIDCYGSVSFSKSIISYMQILIDFGFLLSGTKDIISVIKNKGSVNKTIGNTLYAQIILCLVAIVITVVCCFSFKVLKGFELFTFLSLGTTILSIFLFEYVFKAYEKMDKIAIRYVIMRVISLVFTLIFVKNDKTVILLPIFDIIASFIAIIMVGFQLKKIGVKCAINFKNIKEALNCLKSSFIYFISNFATTAFTALNTLVIGIFLTKADIAYWTVALQAVGVVQALYSPVINSVFPTMVKNKDLKIIHKILLIYMPLILVGCILILILGDWAVNLVFTSKYLTSSKLLKFLIPVLIFSFPGMLYGWPCLGAIDKQKSATISTIVSAVVQVIGILFLIVINQFNLISLCIVRNLTEIVLFLMRFVATYKNKNLFN